LAKRKASIETLTRLTKGSGFTLIELMVVLAIMSTLFALIGPNLIKVYEKAKFQSELVELRESLRKISYKAFINGRAVAVYLNSNSMRYQYLDSDKKALVKQFNYIAFPEQNIKVSSTGFTDKLQILVSMGEVETALSLAEVNTL